MRRALRILLPILLVAGSLAAAGYLRSTKPAVQPTPAVERVWSVRTQVIAFADRQPSLELYGDVVAGREVTLRPLVAGEIIEASAQLVEGGRLAAGELVVAVDPFDYQAAIDELAAVQREAQGRLAEWQSTLRAEWSMLRLDETQLELSRRQLGRREKLQGSQAASEQALDDAQMAVAQEEAATAGRRQTIATVEAKIAQQDAAIERLGVQRARAERDLANTRLLAPFDGLVTAVGADLGKQVGIGDPIAHLIDVDRLEIRFTLSAADFGRLWRAGLIGRAVEADWQLGTTTFTVSGQVARVETAIDPATGGVEVFAEITANRDDAPLRPGAFVRVRLPDQIYREVAEVPASALFRGDTVYAVEDGRLAPKVVEVVADRGDTVLLRGDLAGGMPIVTSRLAEIGPGIRVEVQE